MGMSNCCVCWDKKGNWKLNDKFLPVLRNEFGQQSELTHTPSLRGFGHGPFIITVEQILVARL